MFRSGVKRSWLLLVALTLGLIAVATEAFAAEVTIEYYNGITGGDRPGMELLVRMFNQQYAGKYKVNMVIAPWDEYYTKIVVGVASGTAPDVGLMHWDRIPEFAHQGVLRPIDDMFQALKLSPNDFLGSTGQLGIYKGKRYAIPLDAHPQVLYYDKDLFEKVGLPGTPRNPAQYLEYAKKLTMDKNGDGSTDVWGTLYRAGSSTFYATLWQMGGHYLGGDDWSEVTLNTPVARKALQFGQELVWKHKVSPNHIWVNKFGGEVAMDIDGIWWLRTAQDLRKEGKANVWIDRADTLFGDVRAGAPAGSHQIVVFKQRKEQPEKIQAVQTFIDFLSRNSALWGLYGGQIPLRKIAYEAEEWKQMTEHQLIIRGQLIFVPPVPWGGGLGVLDELMDKVVQQGQPIEPALEQAIQKLEVKIRETRQKLGL
ncbi:MAG TPA: ABC transporter substrate-binding protein [Firmicutes bacterium]|nr:ABC transporter substrate-binding protein [Bacillota bacterium]